MNLQKTLNFFREVNIENGSNYKISVLEKYQNPLLQKILQMTYDRVTYMYGISLDSLKKFPNSYETVPGMSLEIALSELTRLSSREITGHKALEHAHIILNSLVDVEAEIIRNIIDRDLKINLGTSSINKVYKNLIKKPVYMRCSTYNEKTSARIKYPSVVQLKSDGTYREFTVKDGLIQSLSRSGESYEYPVLNQELPNGVYVGELVLKASEELFQTLGSDPKIQELKEQFKENPDLILPREIGNGLMNSLNPPHDNIVLELWDYITLDEYQKASNKEKCAIPYSERFKSLRDVISSKHNNLKIIDYKIVQNLQQALEFTSEVMKKGFEGSILKNLNAVFRDGTSPDQLKLKLVIQAEMRVTGFTEGTGKNAEYFGAMTFCNDEGTIQGRVGVSSMTEKLRNEIDANRDSVIGKIIEVEFNDITRGEGSETYAFSHPRFIEFRDDKDETDTLERVFEYREMATQLG